MVMFQPTDAERAEARPCEQAMLDAAQRYDQRYSGYYTGCTWFPTVAK